MLEHITEASEIVACREFDEAAGLLQDRRFDLLLVWAPADLEMLKKLATIAGENDVRIVVLLHSADPSGPSGSAGPAALADLPVDGFLLEDEITTDSLRAGQESLARGEMDMPGRLVLAGGGGRAGGIGVTGSVAG